jgi:hypothetical protein
MFQRRERSEVPPPDIALSPFLRQRLRYLAGTVDEKLRERVERAVLQGDDFD